MQHLKNSTLQVTWQFGQMGEPTDPSLIEPYHGLFLVAKSRYNGTRRIHQDNITTATAHLHTPHLRIGTVLLSSVEESGLSEAAY